MNTYYQQNVSRILKTFSTHSINQLSSIQVKALAQGSGSHPIKYLPQRLFTLVLSQLTSPLIYLLLIAAIIIFLRGTIIDATIVSIVLVFNMLVSALQEWRVGCILKLFTALMQQKYRVICTSNIYAQIYISRAVIMGAVLLAIDLIAGHSFHELAVALAALFISLVAQNLPVLLTLVVARGAYQMAQRNVLVKNMQAVETIGRVQALVIDSAGIVTRNELIVRHIFCEGNNFIVSGNGYHTHGSILLNGQAVSLKSDHGLYMLGQALCLLNEVPIAYRSVGGTFEINGDLTQAALFVFSQKIGLKVNQLEQEYQKMHEIPFETMQGYYAAFYEHQDQIIAFVIGTPETIMRRAVVCNLARKAAEEYLHEGLQVVGVAKKVFKRDQRLASGDTSDFRTFLETDLNFLGWCGLEDSLRAEAAYTIAQARKAGLYIIMATGEHQRTALSVAKRSGIFRESDECIDGPLLDLLSDEELKDTIRCTTVFSRMSPLQKVRIVQALQACNLTVALAANSINDAASLQVADVGIDKSGIGVSEVQEMADIILLDSAFINILHAIEQGRFTIAQLKRVILAFFSTSLAEILIIVGGCVTGILYPELRELPFTTAQILWLNIASGSFLNIVLCLEKKDKNLLFQKQWLGNKCIHLVDKGLLIKALWLALLMALGSWSIFLLYAPINIVLARTMTLVTLVLLQWMNAWNCRSQNKSLFELGFFSNRWILLAMIGALGAQLLLLEVPFLQKIFDVQSLNGYQWLFAATVATLIVILEEGRKWVVWQLLKKLY